MNISEWLKDKRDEKKRQRAELRLTQAREEGWQEGQQVGWQKGRQVGRREVIEWYESKKNDPTNNEPPPWEN